MVFVKMEVPILCICPVVYCKYMQLEYIIETEFCCARRKV